MQTLTTHTTTAERDRHQQQRRHLFQEFLLLRVSKFRPHTAPVLCFHDIFLQRLQYFTHVQTFTTGFFLLRVSKLPIKSALLFMSIEPSQSFVASKHRQSLG